MTVGRICHREVHLAAAGDTMEEAAARMAGHRVGTLIVVDEREVPVGIVTDRDIVARALARGKGPRETLVGRVMTKKPRVLPEDAPIEAALDLMRRGGFRRVPVVNARGGLVGVVTLDDVLALLAEEFAMIGALLKKEQPRAEFQLRAGELRRKSPPRVGGAGRRSGSRVSKR